MTPDKATALREAAKDGAWADRRRVARGHATLSEIAKINRFRALANPDTILALLAERERLRGALEKAERDLFTAHDWIAEDARDTTRIRAMAEFHRAARQALEATDDQT